MLKNVAINRPTKFQPAVKTTAVEEINPVLDEMSRAGLMSALDDCCRMLVCDEADMTFADVALFLTNNSYRIGAEMNCRGSLLIFLTFGSICLLIFRSYYVFIWSSISSVCTSIS